MKVVKDDRLSLLSRVLPVGKTYLFSISVLAGFTLTNPPRLMTEAQFWETASEVMGPDQVLDLGWPKEQGEFLAGGLAFAPHGKPVAGLEITIQVGPLKKSLYVFGDRTWEDRASSSPKPFTAMPLTWARAFGGKGYEANPDGCGLEKVVTPAGQVVHPRPNFEYPGEWTTHPDDRPRPAGFGPQGLNWPRRLKNLGNFGEKWLRDQWPGLPTDFDWRYFNLAPTDQRLPGYFQGHEPLEIYYLHPSAEKIFSRLPGINVRLQCGRRTSDGDVLTDLTANLDTVWLWPHLETGALIWHAKQIVSDEEATDVISLETIIDSVVGSVENLDSSGSDLPSASVAASMTPKDGEEPSVGTVAIPGGVAVEETITTPPEETHIAETLTADTSDDEWPAEIEVFRPILPAPEFPIKPQKALAHLEAENLEIQKKLDDLLRAYGVDPTSSQDLTPSVEFMPPEGVPSFPADTTDPAAMRNHIEQQQVMLTEHLNGLLKSHGVDPEAHFEMPSPVLPSLEDAITEIEKIPEASPKLIEAIAALKVLARQTEEQRVALDQQAEKLASSERPEGSPTASVAVSASTKLTREEVLAGYSEGRNFSGMDLSGLNLSDCRLDRIQLAGAVLENIDFSRSSLRNAEMSEALLAGANLTEADLTEASLQNANAADVCGFKTCLYKADLTKVDFTGADLSQADMSLAQLKQADFSRAILTGATAREAEAAKAIFKGARLEAMDWTAAKLTNADFSQVRAEKTNFTRTDLSLSWMADIQANGALFNEAKLVSASAQNGASFQQASLVKADLTRGYFSQVDFSHADFSGACLNGASFVDCILFKVTLQGADARRTDFSRSDLSQASLCWINLAEGSLRQTRLNRTDLSQANLFAVDLYKSIHQDTNLTGANLKRSLLKPWSEL